MSYDDHIADVFSAFGPIQVRRMFSGYGLFRDGLMFGLFHDDVLYLKGDDQNAGEFRELGLAQFTYRRNGKDVRLSYFRAPDTVMDDSVEAAKWARSSFEAARREASSKTKKKSPPKAASKTMAEATTKPKRGRV